MEYTTNLATGESRMSEPSTVVFCFTISRDVFFPMHGFDKKKDDLASLHDSWPWTWGFTSILSILKKNYLSNEKEKM